MRLCFCVTAYLSSPFFPYSESSSSADRPDVLECVALLHQGNHLISSEDCTKFGCRGKTCLDSFVEACYGMSCPGLSCYTSTDSGATNANFGRIDLMWSVALTFWTLVLWLWVGVKEIALVLWVLCLLSLASLEVWRSSIRLLDGVKGPGPATWLLVLAWLSVLSAWTLLSYPWVDVFEINLIVWGLTLLHYGLDAFRVHLR